MKKIYMLLFCLLQVGTNYLNAQINGDFDALWVEDTKGNGALPGEYIRPGTQPVGWEASNVHQKVFLSKKEIVVTPDENRTGGDGFSVKMENKFVGVMGIGSNAPAYVTLGVPWVYAVSAIADCDGGTLGGISYTQRPDSLVGYFKRKMGEEKNEDALILAYLWDGESMSTVKINPKGGFSSSATTEVKDQERCVLASSDGARLIGKAEYKIEGELEEWTRISIPFEYYSDDVPEKLNIIISSSNYYDRGTVGAGNILWADDVELVFKPSVIETEFSLPELPEKCIYGKETAYVPSSNNAGSPIKIDVKDISVLVVEDGKIKFLKPGTTEVVVSQEGSGMYTPAEETILITVMPAPLTVTLTDMEIEYDEETPGFVFAYEGLVDADAEIVNVRPEDIFSVMPKAEAYTDEGKVVSFPAVSGTYAIKWLQEPEAYSYAVTVDKTTKTLTVKDAPEPEYCTILLQEVEGVTTNLVWGTNRIIKGESLDLVITAKDMYVLADMTVKVNESVVYPKKGSSTTLNEITIRLGSVDNDVTILIEGVKLKDETGISGEKTAAEVYTQSGYLYINADRQGRLTIYTLEGELLFQKEIVTGLNAVPLPNGAYVMRFGNVSRKIVVK